MADTAATGDTGEPGDSGTSVDSGLSTGRAVGVWTLIAVATLIGLVASTNVWLQRQALDTDNFVNASDRLLDDEDVQEALATYLVNELYETVDVEAELETRLPEDLQGLAGPAAAALQEPATRAVEAIMGTSQFQAAWSKIVREAHEVLVAVLEDDGTVIRTTDGVVTLELGELVKQVGERVGISEDTLSNIPDDAGQIVIVQSSQLNELQNLVKVIEWVSALAILLVIALYALAVYLAVGARRLTLRNIGWAMVLWGLILLVVRTVAIDFLVDQADNPANQPAAKAIFAIESELLGQLGWVVVIAGFLVVFAAMLAGPTRLATSLRRFLSPALNGSPALLWGGTALIFLLIVWWGPTPAFNQWYTVLILAALFAGGVGALRAQTMREFPDVSLSEVSGDVVSAVRRTPSDDGDPADPPT